jgi:hypothetical protein
MRNFVTNPGKANPDIKLKGALYDKDPGAERDGHVKDTFAICNTSAAHTYGNVSSVVEKAIIDLFPPDTFKTVTAVTALASRQIRHTPNQISKMSMPTFVISPRIDFGQDDNRFLANTYTNDRVHNIFAQYGDGSLLPMAYDKKRKLDIRGHLNRAVVYFDIVLGFQTYMEQTNWMSYLYNVVPIKHNFDITAPLELFIPREFNSLLSHLAGIPIYQENSSVYDYMSYMNSIWGYPITYKLKGSSGTDEFFMYYVVDIDTLVQEPQANPGIKDGQIRRNFDIAFTVRCEFNTIGYFLITHPELRKPQIMHAPPPEAIVPIFSDQINLNDFKLPRGWTILDFPIFKLGIGEKSVSISPLFNKSIDTIIDYHLKHGIPMGQFINIQFRENGSILSREEFYIDWRKKELFVIHPNTHRTYRLLVCINYDYMNTLLKEMHGLE